MSLLSNITFIEVCFALLTVAGIERAMLRFAPAQWLRATGMTA